MAYSPRRTTRRRAAPARARRSTGSYARRSSSVRRAPRRTARTARPQTVKLVIQSAPAQEIASPTGVLIPKNVGRAQF